jgi:hypothetical protein
MSDHRPHGKSLILDEGAARLWFAASRDLSALAKVFPKTRANLRLVQPAPDDAVAKALVPVEPVPVLFRYDAACRAVAECVRVDEAKDIRDKAEAIRVYARQVKNPQLEADAWAIRKRAERQIGKLSLALDTAQGASTPCSQCGPPQKPNKTTIGISKSHPLISMYYLYLPVITTTRKDVRLDGSLSLTAFHGSPTAHFLMTI